MPQVPPFDILIIGAGPAGGACALAAARAGLRTAVAERAVFPRHKVCGDCLNPGVWPVLESLGVAEEIRTLAHTVPAQVRFVSLPGREVRIPLPPGAERVITRKSMDAALLAAAGRAGAAIFESSPVTGIRRGPDGNWHVQAGEHALTSRTLIAADGRNSTACRLLRLRSSVSGQNVRTGRMAIQCHLPCPPDRTDAVSLEWTPHGYCGLAPLADGLLNLCVVCQGKDLPAAKADAISRYGISPDTAWHSIAPIGREAFPPAPLPGVFLTGDTARVVEPFTGEGIFYALATGQLAAEAARRHLVGVDGAAFYRTAHARLYRPRLWINRLAGFMVTRPRMAEMVLALSQKQPALLRWLTGKVTGHSL